MLLETIVKLQAAMNVLRNRFEEEEGQGLVEYALIIALVSIVLVGALTALAGGIGGVFTRIQAVLDGLVGSGSSS